MARINGLSAIRCALEQAGLPMGIAATADLSGGCIHQVMRVTLDDGRQIVAKVNRAANLNLFEEEAHGLRALAATGAVLVPQPLACMAHENAAVLLMDMIRPPKGDVPDSAWRRFGTDLAALHRAEAGDRYGFQIDNHLGTTLQPNAWRDDWVEFNTANRLDFQVKMAVDKGWLTAQEAKQINAVIARLDRFIPRRPKPALLHGDLWSGNVLPALDEQGTLRIAMIDPACSIGDGWADIAMMKLFGGFPQSCFEAYRSDIGESEDVEDRLAVYQLYHVLNHVNLFGRSYARQALALVEGLAAS